jgi:hypothetical protein
MTTKFTSIKPTNFDKQKGVDIDIEHNGEVTTFNVWCDIIDTDNPIIRTSINNGSDSLILTSVEMADFKEPDVSYSDDKTYCYVTYASNSLHIKIDDEGIVLDVWDQNNEDCSVDTIYVLFDELAEYGDYR